MFFFFSFSSGSRVRVSSVPLSKWEIGRFDIRLASDNRLDPPPFPPQKRRRRASFLFASPEAGDDKPFSCPLHLLRVRYKECETPLRNAVGLSSLFFPDEMSGSILFPSQGSRWTYLSFLPPDFRMSGRRRFSRGEGPLSLPIFFFLGV